MIDILKYRYWLLADSYLNEVVPTILNWVNKGHSIDSFVKKKSLADLLPRVEALMTVPEGHPEVDSKYFAADMGWDSKLGLPFAQTSQGNIALITVVGPLTKYGDMCSMGMQDYQSILARVNASDNYAGSVLIIDSPGGTVDGTPEFGLAVANSPKPVGVFGDGLVASAAYWVASQADVIVGNKNNPTEFGSIGTLAMKQDYTKMMEAGNTPQVQIVRAPQSTDKALVNSFEPMTDEIKAELLSDLSALTNQFISTVKAGRENIDANTSGLFSGKTFGVYDAKKAGMIDSVGTLNTAVAKVAELAKQVKQSTVNGPQSTVNERLKQTSNMNILKRLGFTDEKAKELSAETQNILSDLQSNYDAQEKKFSAIEAEMVTLTEKVNGLTTENAGLKAKVSEHEKTIADQQAQLEKAPAGKSTTVVGAGDDELKEAGLNKYKTSVDVEVEELKQQQKAAITFK